MNPAQELFDLFDGWGKEEGHSTYSVRGGKQGDASFWESHTRAIALLAQVRTALDSLDRLGKSTRAWRAYEIDWFRAIFEPDREWRSAVTGWPLRKEAHDALLSLSVMIDLLADVARPTDQRASSVSDAVAEAITMLSDENLPLADNERLYVLTLLQEVRDAVEQKIVLSRVDLRERIDRLNGALLGVALLLDDAGAREPAGRVRTIIGKIVTSTMTFVKDAAAVAGLIKTMLELGQ